MRRTAARVVLVHREGSSMVDDWIDHIELRRTARARFAVWGNKFGEDPNTGRRRWMDWDKRGDLTSPEAVRKAIEGSAKFLGVDLDWCELVPLIASIDWLTAAVIANKAGVKLPPLPSADALLAQRALRPIGRVTIGVIWAYEMHELSMPFERWIRVVNGERWSVDEPYWYEGQRFTGCWSFDRRSGLEVTYDDGGVGWEGDLRSIDRVKGPQLDGVDLASLALSAATPV